MTTIRTTCTDRELDEAVAFYVAGLTPDRFVFDYDGLKKEFCIWKRDGVSVHADSIKFSTNANCVLPLLERRGWKGTSNRAGSTCAATVVVLGEDGKEHRTQATYETTQTPFTRAACFSLLKAHGVTVGE